MSANQNFEEKFSLLEEILEQGIDKLLTLAEKKNYLKDPYGKAPEPSPLVTEEDFEEQVRLALAEGKRIDEIDENPPPCKFEYGFDPLHYLSDFILWSHPSSIERRGKERAEAHEALIERVAHSQKQLKVASSLKDTVSFQRAGILWGPFVTPINSTSVVAIVKPLSFGNVVFEFSLSPTFSEKIEKTVTVNKPEVTPFEGISLDNDNECEKSVMQIDPFGFLCKV